MPDSAREIVAYALIGGMAVTAAIAYLSTRGRRRAQALRRRGIKTHIR